MHRYRWFVIGLAACLGIGSHLTPSQAVQFPDGRVAFDYPPSLIDSATTQRSVLDSSAKYYFDLNVPTNAGEPLRQVVITQRDGDSFARQVDFEADETRAFVGTHRNREEELNLSNVVWNEDEQTLTVTFDPPIAPGTDVTLRLEPERNPRRSGVYLFGVTAFPDGEIPQGQFLGYGRLQFYDRGDSIFDLSRTDTLFDAAR